jgi:hypothetical protein
MCWVSSSISQMMELMHNFFFNTNLQVNAFCTCVTIYLLARFCGCCYILLWSSAYLVEILDCRFLLHSKSCSWQGDGRDFRGRTANVPKCIIRDVSKGCKLDGRGGGIQHATIATCFQETCSFLQLWIDWLKKSTQFESFFWRLINAIEMINPSFQEGLKGLSFNADWCWRSADLIF